MHRIAQGKCPDMIENEQLKAFNKRIHTTQEKEKKICDILVTLSGTKKRDKMTKFKLQ